MGFLPGPLRHLSLAEATQDDEDSRSSASISRMRDLALEIASVASAKLGQRAPEHGGIISAALVRAILADRKRRHIYFSEGIFADPAFDMMLDLLAARMEGKRVSVSSLCLAAGVPASTALRWITRLTEQGLVERSLDPEDGRRVFLRLSDDAARRLTAYLDTSPAAI